MSKHDRMRSGSPDEVIDAVHQEYDAGTAAILTRFIKGITPRVKHHNALQRTAGVPGKGSAVIPAARTKTARAAASRRGRNYRVPR